MEPTLAAPSGLEQQLASLRQLARAVARPGGPALVAELVHELAAVLDAALVFVAVADDAQGATWRTVAAELDGRTLAPVPLVLDGPLGEAALGQCAAFGAVGLTDCVACPLPTREGARSGVLVALDRRPLGDGDAAHAAALLQIVAGRIAGEFERHAAEQAVSRAEANFQAIFDASEEAIFIHDWTSGRIVDANHRACASLGWTRAEFADLSVADICAGMPPYTVDDALRWIELARVGRCPPFVWRRRNKDGSLHWDEVRLKPATIYGRPHVLAFTRDITERKTSLAALQAQEQKYRAIFDASADSMVLWSDDLRVVDANAAFVHMTGLPRDQVVGRHWSERPDRDDMRRLLWFIEAALNGREERAVERVSRVEGAPFDIELRYLPVQIGGARFALGIGREVTAQLEHERALARSAARLRATVEAAFDGVVGMDGDGRIVEFNGAAERTFGHRREAVIGRLLAEVLLPPRHREAHARGLTQFIRGGQGPMIGRLVETTALHADGHEIPVELAISVAAVPEGSIFVGHLRDITERRRADQALRASEEQYRAIFNASADALVLRAADFSIVDVNATYEAMSGYSRAEVLGIDRVLANPPEVGEVIRALHDRALAGEPIALATQLLRRDGVRYDLELRGVPIRHRGEPHVLYIGRDITKGRRAELALRDSEAQYRAIFNASADALILRDAAFRAVEVNPALTTLSGFSREELLSSTRVLLSDRPEDDERFRDDHRRALAGEVLRFEGTARRKDGQRRHVEVRGTPVSYRGEPHVLYAVRDMTERHAAEQRRSELERQLRQAQKMEAIGQLTGGIAHDFNNILASVIGYLVLAEERAEAIADATLVRQLGQAHLAADRARELIAQMLAFARRQRGERRALAVAPLVQQTLTLLRATLPATVTLDVDAGPDAEATACAVADPVHIEQVLFNLCINARDAVGGVGRICVALRCVDDPPTWHCASCRSAVDGRSWVVLAVEDDGPGVAAEVAERIFDPFFSTKAPGRGSGMGLAMVHGIVHEHDGHVELRTAPGRGTRFAVWLPRTDRAAPGVGGVPATRPASGALRGRVLLVEDDAMVGAFLVERLAGWGLEVTLEREPLAAAAWLAGPANRVDLLLTDQTMPHLTGLQLAERAHALRPALPIVLVSGNASAFDADELERCGVSAALAKPIDAEHLRATLRRLLAASGVAQTAD